MFIVGGGAIIGAVLYGAHSDHSNHYNYSEYADADALLEIQKKKMSCKEKKKNRFGETAYCRKIGFWIKELKNDLNLLGNVTVNNIGEAVEEKYREILKHEIEEDRKKYKKLIAL